MVGSTFAPEIKINGSPMAYKYVAVLAGVRIDRALGVVGRAKLVFHDRDYELSTQGDIAVGHRIEIAAPSPRPSGGSESVPVFWGEVTGIGLEQMQSGAIEYTVVVDEMSHRLRRNTVQQTFLNHKYSDIVRSLCQAAGLTLTASVDSEITHDYTLVTGSPLAFLDDASRRIGAEWSADVASNKIVLRTASPKPAPDAVLQVNEDMRRFSVRANAEAPRTIAVSGWDQATQRKITGTSVPTHPSEGKLATAAAAGRGVNVGVDKLLVSGGQVASQAEAEVLTKSVLKESWASAMTARGTTHTVQPGLTLGGSVKITGAGPASGTYRVTELEHVYDPQGFRSTFVAGSYRPSRLVDLLDRSGEDSGFQRHQVVVGKVTAHGDAQNNGRVKVELVTMDQVESTWARILSPDAGKDRGIVFLPEIGDEVLVAFEHGDTRRPIVLGGLFSGSTKLPTKDQKNVGADGGVSHRRITSRSGHIIELDDTSGAEKVTILHKSGHEVVLDAKKGISVSTTSGQDIVLTTGQATVTLTKTDVKVEGVNISLKATAKVAIEAPAVEIKATGSAKVEGGLIQVKADSVAAFEAGGPLTLKGAIVKVN